MVWGFGALGAILVLAIAFLVFAYFCEPPFYESPIRCDEDWV